jgi:hypothetical protein
MTTWDAVILDLPMPWYLVTVLTQEGGIELSTDVLVATSDNLLAFIRDQPMGPVVGVHVVAPPGWSATQGWEFIQIRRIEQRLKPRGVFPGRLALTRLDGMHIDGRGFAPTTEDPAQLELLADFTQQLAQEAAERSGEPA